MDWAAFFQHGSKGFIDIWDHFGRNLSSVVLLLVFWILTLKYWPWRSCPKCRAKQKEGD